MRASHCARHGVIKPNNPTARIIVSFSCVIDLYWPNIGTAPALPPILGRSQRSEAAPSLGLKTRTGRTSFSAPASDAPRSLWAAVIVALWLVMVSRC
jgi:hypothetical protein